MYVTDALSTIEMDLSCGVLLLLVTCVFGVGRVGQILSSVSLWLLYFDMFQLPCIPCVMCACASYGSPLLACC